jgi:hypothetical protein
MSAIEQPAFTGSRHRQEARLALDQQVVRLFVAVRAIGAVTRNITDDDRRLGRRQRSVRQAKPRRGAGRQVLYDDVGVVDDQSLQDRARFRMLDVEGQALLRAIGPDEMRGEAAHPFVVGACEIADARTFYLDDPRPEIGELSRRERPGDGVLESDDGDAGERLHEKGL